MRTIDKIIDLLDERDRAMETQRLMISGGMACRTDAGSRFFMNRINDCNNAMRELSKYPYEWIEAARKMIEIRYIKGRFIEI